MSPIIIPSAEIYIKTQSKVYQVSRFQRCKVTLSRSLPCDICELTLPKLDSLKLFKENDEIAVSLGNDQLGSNTVFKGYISTISPRNEPVLTAEDYFKTFKEKRNSKFYDDITNDNIAKDVIQFCGFQAVIPDTWETKRDFYWKMQTAAEALAELAVIGWDYFCIPTTKKIYFGKPYDMPDGILPSQKFVYRFGLNIIENQLEYRTATPFSKAIVYCTDSKWRGPKITVEEGSGEPVKIFNLQMSFDPDSTESVDRAMKEARKFAKQQIAQSQVEGYRGTFKTFGNPFVFHSMKIKIEDPDKQERSGHYFIDQVIHDLSAEGGYKMEISIGGSENVQVG